MRFSSSINVFLLGSLLPIAACASGLTLETGSQSGSGGDGSTSSVSSAVSSSGMSGPCKNAQDCAAFSDTCNVGTCINAKCVKSPTNDGVGCDDGKNCTQNDLCQSGVCTGSLKFCPSSDGCHIGMCDVETDTCVEIPGNEGAVCIDDDPCTQTGSCAGGVCAPGKPTDCSFLDGECSMGTCDPQVGCVTMPIADGMPCQDGFYCTVNDHCQGGACTGDPNTCAAPGDVCKIGSCNEAMDTCVAVNGNNGASCDDMSACTTGETCSNGLCGGGAPANQGGSCNDKNACTTVDMCDNGACLGSAPIVQCINGDGCCPQNCSLAGDTDCCCGDTQNDFPPDFNCSQGAPWIAWQYVPTCTFNVTRIEIHSDGGNVALLADNNGFPGATLFQGQLGPPDPQGWIGSDVMPPIALTSGTTYWIAENVSLCSIATGGNQQPYYGSFNTLAGPWDGPFLGHFWTSHVIGQCAP